MKVEWVEFGSICTARRLPVDIDPALEYKKAGVRSFGKGLFSYDPAPGADIGKLRFFELERDRLVISNIKAWEGAVAVTSSSESGRVVSNRFLTYSSNVASLQYLMHWFLSARGGRTLQAASPGSADRNRTLAASRLDVIKVPVPPRSAQERIATHLDSIERQLSQKVPLVGESAIATAEESFFSRFPTTSLGEFAEVGPSPTRLEPAHEVAFVPMGAVSAEAGHIDSPSYLPRGEVGSGYRQFTTGDILFARITPSMQNGKSAVFDDPRVQFGYGSTEFHVLRPHDPAYSRWIWVVLRTRWLRDQAMKSFTGTAGQQRVPASFLERVQIPIPAPHQLDDAIEQLVTFHETLKQVATARCQRDERAAAVLPAARNEIFNAMR